MSCFIDRSEVLGELRKHLVDPDGPSADSLLTDAETYRLEPHRLLERSGRNNRYGHQSDRPALTRALARTGPTGEFPGTSRL
ncbi:hypothetical protein OG689_38285 [Kitasatospora sp. NBC_00240]|uniref:hypothetical protein n=1 Tax=Kitasatospora sp. NBC_00240 TaxID=2903567 RepID=UPI00224CDB8A|nr:hypothetical protein [Kitasatospora sp. NBC_00240]MCX5215044.1 hypothetical protein [Kitasatospora sp. NBC_00240]